MLIFILLVINGLMFILGLATFINNLDSPSKVAELDNKMEDFLLAIDGLTNRIEELDSRLSDYEDAADNNEGAIVQLISEIAFLENAVQEINNVCIDAFAPIEEPVVKKAKKKTTRK